MSGIPWEELYALSVVGYSIMSSLFFLFFLFLFFITPFSKLILILAEKKPFLFIPASVHLWMQNTKKLSLFFVYKLTTLENCRERNKKTERKTQNKTTLRSADGIDNKEKE